MGGITITVTVEGGFDFDLGGDNGGGAGQDNGEGGHWEVKHEAGACAPCVGNNDPDNVPFWGCNGNIDRIDPDEGLGNGCRCEKVWVEDDTEHSRNNEDF